MHNPSYYRRCRKGTHSRIHHAFTTSNWSCIGLSASARSSSSRLVRAGASVDGSLSPVALASMRASMSPVHKGCCNGLPWGPRCVPGCSPRASRASGRNWTPDLVRKHSWIIQRREILARLCLVSFRTDPPPTSTQS